MKVFSAFVYLGLLYLTHLTHLTHFGAFGQDSDYCFTAYSITQAYTTGSSGGINSGGGSCPDKVTKTKPDGAPDITRNNWNATTGLMGAMASCWEKKGDSEYDCDGFVKLEVEAWTPGSNYVTLSSFEFDPNTVNKGDWVCNFQDPCEVYRLLSDGLPNGPMSDVITRSVMTYKGPSSGISGSLHLNYHGSVSAPPCIEGQEQWCYTTTFSSSSVTQWHQSDSSKGCGSTCEATPLADALEHESKTYSVTLGGTYPICTDGTGHLTGTWYYAKGKNQTSLNVNPSQSMALQTEVRMKEGCTNCVFDGHQSDATAGDGSGSSTVPITSLTSLTYFAAITSLMHFT